MRGIYKIKNIATGNFYIGSSKNIEFRWKTHLRQLRTGTHPNTIMQKNFNKYGIENLKLEIIYEALDNECLLDIEQIYIDELKPNMNIGKCTYGGDNLTNHPKRNEIIKQIRKSAIRRAKNLGDEYWIKWGEQYQGEKNPNYGNRWSDEKKIKQSIKMKRYFDTHSSYRTGKTNKELFGKDKAEKISKKISNHAKQRIGSKNSFWGKSHTEKFKQNQSERMKGNIPKNRRPFTIDDQRYENLYDAQSKLNINFGTIQYRLNSSNKKFNNYQYLNSNV